MSGDKDMMEKMQTPPKKQDEVSKNPNQELEKMIHVYLESNPAYKKDNKISELEIRFGTNPKLSKPLTKMDYEKVVKQLYTSGFTCDNPEGNMMMRIQNEYIDPKQGIKKTSNVRAEIIGVQLIQEYCKTNSISSIINMASQHFSSTSQVKFTQKTASLSEDKTPLRPVNFDDFNFRVSYQLEQDYTPNSNSMNIKSIISNWNNSKKLFRHINRVHFRHTDYPLLADISILKGNKKTGKVPIPQYTVQDAHVFENIETYEVELEIDNSRVGNGTPYNTPKKIIDIIKKGVRIILSALQGTAYPISYVERDKILQKYMKLIHGDKYVERRVTDRDFIGPSSVTLKIDNIMEESSGAINIRNHYTVTDKADGERKLLYISDNGRIYMIDNNMNVIFTGTFTNEKTLHNSLFDGEHIQYDKFGKYIHLYAAFDIYYCNNTNVRPYSFTKIKGEEEIPDNKYRLYLLEKAVELSKITSIMDSGSMTPNDEERKTPCHFTIKCKEFKNTIDDTIFKGCASILDKIKDGTYQYNTDGLIFTPCNTGVGGTKKDEMGPDNKFTWNHSFKWKPAEFNTIDFLVSVQKDKNGKDKIHNLFKEGISTSSTDISQYKTLILRCGFDEKKHGFLNPFQMMIDNAIQETKDIDNVDSYKPAPFMPTNPYDEKACFCNIMLIKSNDSLVMKTTDDHYFEEDMIVEFSYNPQNEADWRWVPIRVRYDKTAKLRAGLREYGNPYHVSNDIWNSIHNPIHEEMIASGAGIPTSTSDQDVYYNRSNEESNTRGLRNFHNLYVKRKLIMGVSHRNNTLIDFAVGKAGDLSKWTHAKLGFVFGIDVSKDNIFNHLDGACARYLKDRMRYNNTPDALFINGNSSLNIRSGKGTFTDKDKTIIEAVFGNGPKDRNILGEGVYKHYGVAQEGFNISSCQFALHYFFESPSTLHNFIRNLVECTCVNGYFIGTCYDGETVFNLLKKKPLNDSISIMKGNKKVHEIVKLYTQTGFPVDENSIGYPINVYQESINNMIREYLVNFRYFQRLMENYGFVIVSKEESAKMDMPNGTGMFDELFHSMEDEIRRDSRAKDDYGDAYYMTEYEKDISFLNRYFIFKKIRHVDALKISRSMFTQSPGDEEESKDEDDVLQLNKEKGKEKIEQKTIKFKKLKYIKIAIQPDIYSPIETENPPPTTVSTNEVSISENVVKFKIPKNITKKNRP
jgi:hypothetical protein